ncbi:MAG TPA: 4'-phosphopantetheinyl transferase superfamily protein [Gemmatimonadetes bacterium]|nr:4'-phosphopantetheinyl transferase superfamily protein [Gemmatimonadota bacterium]
MTLEGHVPDLWHPAREWERGAEDIIDVWRFELDVQEHDWAILTPDETRSARRIVVAEKGGRKASARANLRRILARYIDTPPEDVSFVYGEHGKPMLAEQDEPQFNLSDSGTKGLVAVSRGVRIGVDIEHARGNRSFTGIADRFFAQSESDALRALPSESRPAAFYRAWTRKEAYLKAWGTGLTFASNRFTLDYVGEGPGTLLTTEMPNDDVSRWHFRDVALGQDYKGAICFEGPDRPIRWWTV